MESSPGKIHLIKGNKIGHGNGQSKADPSKAVSMDEKTLSTENIVSKILESAASFNELGLIEEAAAEYEKIYKMDCHPGRIIPGHVACLHKILSPSKIVKRIEAIISDLGLTDRKKVLLKCALAVEMEKEGQNDLAFDLYKDSSEIYPENKEIKNKLNSVLSRLSSGSKYDYLLNLKIVTSDQLQKALAISKKTKKSVEFVLIDHFKVSKEDVGKSLSLFYGTPFKSFDPAISVPVELISNLKKAFLMHDMWVPLSWGKEGVEILVDDPKDLRKTGQIRGLIKTQRIILLVGIKEDIEKYITYFFQKKKEAPVDEMVEELDLIPDISFEEEEEIEDEEDDLDEASGQVVRLVDQILVTAFRKDVSDIHIEPSPVTRFTDVRFRMDGVCQEYIKVPNTMSRGILSRLKIMAGLDIAERRLPQDGKIKFKRKGVTPFELRLATLPTTGGFEDAVLRILAQSGAMALDDMGLNERNIGILKKIIAQPYGLILVVGPTGSGKTTTLHSALGYINKPGIKIWTAEDPVEITQAGLRQVEAKAGIGLDFARIMRAFLRADPDVIMIGEMRDQETASIGVEASLTGHLVFSTLHTNSAPETITRLLDMGLNPLNFSDAFLGVLAQRLTRRLCSKCREAYHPNKDEFDEIVNDYGEEGFAATNITYTPELKLYRPAGCSECSNSGYKGRMGIHELMEGTGQIKRLIKKQAPTEELFSFAHQDGMTTLKQDGIRKVFQGLTDISEIRRVCID